VFTSVNACRSALPQLKCGEPADHFWSPLMRRSTAAVGTALAVGAGVLVAVPTSASAVVAPSLVSVSASPKSVTTVGKLNAAKKVTVTGTLDNATKTIKVASIEAAK